MIKIKLGTRGSPLALKQSNMVKNELEKAFPDKIEVEIVIIKTSADIFADRKLSEIGGKGLFIKELEDQLLEGKIDIAVHSMKDVPAFIHDELDIVSCLKREDPRDAFLSLSAENITNLAYGAKIGTSSPRRKAFLTHIRPDLQLIDIRGNVGTRIDKLKSGELDAIILASSGLKRLNINIIDYKIIGIEDMLPAACQAIIGIECKKDRKDIIEILAHIKDNDSYQALLVERAFLQGINGDCQTPTAAFLDMKDYSFRAMLASDDFEELKQLKTTLTPDDAEKKALELGVKLKSYYLKG